MMIAPIQLNLNVMPIYVCAVNMVKNVQMGKVVAQVFATLGKVYQWGLVDAVMT